MKLNDITLISIAGHDRFISANKKALKHCRNLCDFSDVKLLVVEVTLAILMPALMPYFVGNKL